MIKSSMTMLTVILTAGSLGAREYHVSPAGHDQSEGTAARPFRTISAGARVARPGDVITVHEGIYRERVNPLRGGMSNEQRIVYRAAPGEAVVIKGSEIVKGWEKVQNDTWRVTLSNSFFGSFNPYRDVIRGDWFNPKGRVHHTGAVYLNGHWLTEAPDLTRVLAPAGEAPLWSTDHAVGESAYLLNVSWLDVRAGSEARERIPADAFAAQHGIRTASSAEGGQCIGWIEDGDWVRYEKIDFGQRSEFVEVRVASNTQGGRIELRLDGPGGEVLGTCTVPSTGGWQTWMSVTAPIKPTSGARNLCLVFKSPGGNDDTTTIWAQFPDVDPNEETVEINVRQSVFYPEEPGINYITVRGFIMKHAATPWAPPTAEQIGLVGTHWSQGWIIEDNIIRYSTCTGVTLGKYGDEWDNQSQSADAYNRTINRALENGWSKTRIGGHIVRNNHISHCEQAGIVGSLGAVFSTIRNNEIHDIHVRRLFTGAEMAGIKIHASIDLQITGNYIHHAYRGIWLDWMAQGTRITRNLLHDNDAGYDLFVEVNHGPYLVDHNLFLSSNFLLDWSQGGAFAHNLAAGNIKVRPQSRTTPYHKAHSTEVAGLDSISCGDNRFYNNMFLVQDVLAPYQSTAQPVTMKGNVTVRDAALTRKPQGLHLLLSAEIAREETNRPLVTTGLLGQTLVSGLPFETPFGSPYRLDTDYFGKKRNAENPTPGPFRLSTTKDNLFKVWPRELRGKREPLN